MLHCESVFTSPWRANSSEHQVRAKKPRSSSRRSGSTSHTPARSLFETSMASLAGRSAAFSVRPRLPWRPPRGPELVQERELSEGVHRLPIALVLERYQLTFARKSLHRPSLEARSRIV